MQSIFVILLSLAQGYQLCSRTDYPYKGQNISAPIQYSATRQFTLNGQTIQVQISGTVEVVDGCSFKVSNLVLGGGNYTASFFGGIIGSGATAVRLSDGTVTSGGAPINQQFEFITNAGAAVSYYDFNQLRFFVQEAQALIGTADLPGKVTAPGTVTTTTGAKPTTSTSNPAATTTSGAILQFYSAPLLLVLGFVLTCL